MLIAMLLVTTVSLVAVESPSSLVAEPQFRVVQGHSLASVDLQRVNWTSNHIPDGGFDVWANPRIPSLVTNYQTHERYHWYAMSPVSHGSRSIGIQLRATDTFVWQNTQWRLTNIFADMRNLSLSLSWWPDENPDPGPGGDSLYLRLFLNDGKEAYYTLNGVALQVNSTTDASFQMTGPLKTWNVFDRNITDDVLSVTQLGYGGVIPGGLQLTHLYIHVFSSGSTGEFIRAFLDNVRMVNSTTVYVDPTTRDGSFEAGGAWSSELNKGLGIFSQSSTAKTDPWSLNMTLNSDGNASEAMIYDEPMVRLTSENLGVLSLWYSIRDWTLAAPGTMTYIRLDCVNSTNSFTVFYYICYGGPTVGTNTSSDLHITPSNFNITGSWVHINRNILDDAGPYFSTNKVGITDVTLRGYSDTQGSRLEILFDDFELRSAALGSIGFEDQDAAGNGVRGFTSSMIPSSGSTFSVDGELSVTSDSFSGTKAANLTIVDADALTRYHYLSYRPLTQNTETYFDFAWNLEDYSETLFTWAGFALRFQDGKWLYYLCAQSMSVSNLSTQGYIFLPNHNTKNTWFEVHRNLVHDYEAVFGSLPNTAITSLALGSVGSAEERIELLLDDLYLYDDPAPGIQNVLANPTTPGVNEDVSVSADVIDAGIDDAILHYRVDGGALVNESMVLQLGDTYQASIPGRSYGDYVEYFLTANDTFGKTTRFPSDASYLSFTPTDALDPHVSWHPGLVNGSVFVGEKDVTVIAGDSESGIARVEFYLDGVLVSNQTISPPSSPSVDNSYIYTWDTTTVANANYTFVVRVFDVAGNQDQVTIDVSVLNITPPTTPTTTTGPPPPDLLLIAAAAGAAALVTFVLYYYFVIRPKERG